MPRSSSPQPALRKTAQPRATSKAMSSARSRADDIRREINIQGARENNLKNIHLKIPKGQLIVLTGPSGSGKSTLAFDTIHAEGQRRYIESLSAYARQFVEQLKKPEVDSITGLCPSLAIQQKRISQNPRSTVATISEIYDYMRLLWSRVGQVIDPRSGEKLSVQTHAQMSDAIWKLGQGAKVSLLAVLAEKKKGSFSKEIDHLVRQGLVRARIDGIDYSLQLGQKLDKNKPHDIEVYIDRLVIKEGSRDRLEAAVEKASEVGEGRFKVHHVQKDRYLAFSQKMSSSDGEFSIPEMTPRLFSFNSPIGFCPTCRGLGYLKDFEDDEDGEWEEEEVSTEDEREDCPDCEGSRLRLESRCIYVGGKSIDEVHEMPILDAKRFVDSVKLKGNQAKISQKILEELSARLSFLAQVGLDYLNLNRGTATLSGGEEQRVRLATQMGVHLRGVLYVLDEPSIGLHQLDNDRLIAAMKKLRDMGNTVLVVEHDLDTMRAADQVIDLGPGAGVHGGEVIDQASPEKLKKGITADYLHGKKRIEIPRERRRGSGKCIEILGAHSHNLKDVRVQFPLGCFTVVTGVSGSGKSSLVLEVLGESMRRQEAIGCEEIRGLDEVDKVIEVTQSPIGRSPRSNPATYIGMFSPIRDLYAKTPIARQRGYGPGRFSFNVKAGRCDACEGAGELRIEMHFLPNVRVPCETCFGRRYNRATLEALYKGKNIFDVLDMTFEEAEAFFEVIPAIHIKAKTMCDVGLGYLKLGQSALTLSGGEAQRVKLAKELSKRQQSESLYILDEPTTGLHLVDIELLLKVVQKIVDHGHSVVMIEHQLDLIKAADHLIDLGPLGGIRGGQIIGQGSPEVLAKNKKSHTGNYLRRLLEKEASR